MTVPAHLQGLQAHPLAQRNRSQEALDDLKKSPLRFLQETVVIANAGNGVQTAFNAATSFAFNQQQNTVRIGPNATGWPGAVTVPTLATPTRTYADPHRLAATVRCGINGADLWITDQQTGCTVLVVDWGLDMYSMLHLLPGTMSSYGAVSRAVLNLSNAAKAAAQNHFLRNEATAVTNSTLGRPRRYIMVQSQFAINKFKLMQVIGVAAGGRWNFYLQMNGTNHRGQIVERVEQLAWRSWDDAFYRTH